MARRSTQRQVGAAPEKIALARQLRREMTPAERLLWERLRRKTLGIRARPQHIIHGWIVDFYLPAANLVVEVDGDVHDLQPDEDARRDQDLGDVGITVLRFRNDEVFANIEAVVARVAEEVLAPYPRYRAPFPPPSGGKGSSAREGTSVGQRVSKGRSPGQ